MSAVFRFLDQLTDTRHPRLWLSLLCLVLWLPGFAVVPPSDRDESRFAQASRQMVQTGDYVRIQVGEEERNKKPVGIHWLQVSAVHVAEALHIGSRDDIWPYRVPSLLGAWLAVLATFHWGRALVGRRAAMLAAGMLASCLVLVVETHIAKTDAALLATVAASMGLFGRAYLAPQTFSARQAAAFWVILGVSVLLKGPIGPMVPLLTGITLAIADRRAPWFRPLRLHWGIPLLALICAPWLIAIGIATEGRFFSQAVGGDMLGKVGSGDEKHWGPPGYYILTFGVAAFPAAFLVLRALPGAWRDRVNPGTRFLLAWIIPSWLVFEAVATKLPHYSLPTYPALMLLGGAWAMDPLRQKAPRWLAWVGMAALAGVAVVLALAAPALPRIADTTAAYWPLIALPFAGLLIWAVARALKAGQPARAGWLAAVLAVPLYAIMLHGVLPSLRAPWISPRLAEAVRQAAPGLAPRDFGIAGYAEPSMLFALDGGIRLLGNGEAAADFLAAAPGRLVAVSNRDEARFRARVAALGLTVTGKGDVDGFNYTRGRRVALELYTRAP